MWPTLLGVDRGAPAAPSERIAQALESRAARFGERGSLVGLEPLELRRRLSRDRANLAQPCLVFQSRVDKPDQTPDLTVRIRLHVLELDVQQAVWREMAEHPMPLFDQRIPEACEVREGQRVVEYTVLIDERIDQRLEPRVDSIPEPIPGQQPQDVDSPCPKDLQVRHEHAEGIVPAHGDGRLPSIAVHVNHARLGKRAQERRCEQQGPSRPFGPGAAAEPLTQPLEEIPEVVGEWLPGLSPNHRFQFVEQGFVLVGEVRECRAQNGRHIAPREADTRFVERIEQLLVGLSHHETGPDPMTAIEVPHPVPGGPTVTERPHSEVADELGETEHTRVPVQDVRHHRGAAPSGAQNEDRWNGYGPGGGYHGLAFVASK